MVSKGSKDLSVGEPATIERLQRELATKQATVDALMLGFSPSDFPVIGKRQLETVLTN